jgi:hypothetical protein
MNRDLKGIAEYIRDRVSPPGRKALSGAINKRLEGSANRRIEIEDVEYKSKTGFPDSGTNKRTEPKLAYGGKAPLPKDADNRVHSLERENLKLKSKESLLELEIRK